MTSHYFSCAETAKLVRNELKSRFPGVKFSVRSNTYAGGASIDVSWVDGPAAKIVDAVVGQFAGGRFDSSIDMAYNVSHWMTQDGRIVIASNPGTGDQKGSHSAERNWMPEPDAKLVHFGADFIFTKRAISPNLARRALDRLAAKGYPVECVEIRVSDYNGEAYIHQTTRDETLTRGFDMEREANEAIQRTHCAA
ncbi:MAG: hypothetical protein B7X48_14310 [Acidiphilium sp. 34-60-192]|nr:MAG: hypothetical protein B7X48_14310 [Acidiphilium sp. 34-60-192]